MIFIANGVAARARRTTTRWRCSRAAGGDTSQLTYPTSVVKSTDQANWADEFARFMRGADVSSKDGAQVDHHPRASP